MENKNDVKGGLVIEQMKRYAKRLADHTGGAVNIRIEVWYHPDPNQDYYSGDFILWDASASRFIELPYKLDDLRGVGKLIDDLIAADKAGARFVCNVG